MKKILLVLIMAAQPLLSQENTVYFTKGLFTPVDCSQSYATAYFSVLWNNVIAQKEFSTDRTKAAKDASPAYQINGTITFAAVKKDDKAITKYLSEEETGDKYLITVTVTNMTTGQTDTSYRDTVYSASKLNASAVKIANQIIKKYRREQTAFPAKTGAMETTSYFSMQAIEITPLTTIGFGKYTDYNKAGIGLSVGCLFKANQLYLKPVARLAYGFAGLPNIRTNINTSLVLNAGYFQYRKKSFSLTPYLGCGGIYHHISGTKDGKNKSYNYINPIANLSLSVEYMLNECFSIIFVPQYNIFAEKSKIDQFFEAAVGIKNKL